MKNIKTILVEKINRSEWWHVTPSDPDAYKKRGKFLANTFLRADFYGRPNDIPDKVDIANPIYGFSEKAILKKLFPNQYKKIYSRFSKPKKDWYEYRIDVDAKMARRAKELGHDAIVLMGCNGRKYLEKNRKPPSIELDLLSYLI